MPAQIEPSVTLSGLLGAQDMRYGETPLTFVTADGRSTTTLRELRDRATRLAGGLRRLGVRPRDHVAFQLPLCADAIVAQFAALMLDAVLVPVVPVFGAKELTQVFRDVEPKAFLTTDRWRKVDYAANLESIPHAVRPPIIVMSGDPIADAVPWAELEAEDPVTDWAEADEDATSLIIFTSGSTGTPKGVRHSRRTALAEAVDVGVQLEEPDSELCYLYTSGAGHIAGFVYPLRVLLRGMRCVVIDGWDPSLAAQVVHRDRPDVMAGLPFHVVSMLDAAESSGLDLSSLRMAMIGGAPVSAALIERAERAGVRIVRSYGLTELPTAALGGIRADLATRCNHVGRATGGNEIRIVDDRGRVLPADSRGEIQLRGPEMFIGYTNVPAEQTFTHDGWFPTGDIGELTEDGLLSVVDRKKNIIIRGGENLSASEIEDLLVTHPSVIEAAVVGVPDDRYGERVCAFLVVADGVDVTPSDLLDHFVRSGASKQKTPEFVEIVPALPRTATGKLQKRDLVWSGQCDAS